MSNDDCLEDKREDYQNCSVPRCTQLVRTHMRAVLNAECWLSLGSVFDWVKKCMEYEVEGSRPRGGPKRTWKEVVQKDCQARNLNKEDAVDRGRWKKLIKIG